MKSLLVLITFFCATAHAELQLEAVPRLDTATAIRILAASQKESLEQKVDVSIIIVGLDGRILASSRSEKMGPQLYEFARHKAQTSWFKSVATEELPARNGQGLEIIDTDQFKIIRGVKGGIPLFYKGKRVGAVGVSGAHPDVDKVIALKGIADLPEISDKP